MFFSGTKGLDREDLPETRMQPHFSHEGSNQVKYFILVIVQATEIGLFFNSVI